MLDMVANYAAQENDNIFNRLLFNLQKAELVFATF